MKRFKRETVALLLMMITNSGFAQRINGNVVDKKTGEYTVFGKLGKHTETEKFFSDHSHPGIEPADPPNV